MQQFHKLIFEPHIYITIYLGSKCMIIMCILVCRYEGTIGRVAVAEGKHIRSFSGKSLDECKKLCDGENKCNSFALCIPGFQTAKWKGDNCFLKEKVITRSEITKDFMNKVTNDNQPHTCTTYGHKCGNYYIF